MTSPPKRHSSSSGSCGMEGRICSRQVFIWIRYVTRLGPCVLWNVSGSATAAISIRCWPFRCERPVIPCRRRRRSPEQENSRPSSSFVAALTVIELPSSQPINPASSPEETAGWAIKVPISGSRRAGRATTQRRASAADPLQVQRPAIHRYKVWLWFGSAESATSACPSPVVAPLLRGFAAQPVAEGLHFGPLERSRGGDDIVGELVGQCQREEPHQPAGGEVGGGDGTIGQHHAVAGDRRIECEMDVVEAEAGGRRDT